MFITSGYQRNSKKYTVGEGSWFFFLKKLQTPLKKNSAFPVVGNITNKGVQQENDLKSSKHLYKECCVEHSKKIFNGHSSILFMDLYIEPQ